MSHGTGSQGGGIGSILNRSHLQNQTDAKGDGLYFTTQMRRTVGVPERLLHSQIKSPDAAAGKRDLLLFYPPGETSSALPEARGGVKQSVSAVRRRGLVGGARVETGGPAAGAKRFTPCYERRANGNNVS